MSNDNTRNCNTQFASASNEDKDIQYGLKILEANQAKWKNCGSSDFVFTPRQLTIIILPLVILLILIFFTYCLLPLFIGKTSATEPPSAMKAARP